jgi:hypothetical protein
MGGRVEGAGVGGSAAALHEGGEVGHDAGAEERAVESAGEGEDRVADGLGFEAADGHVVEELVLGVERPGVVVGTAGHAVGAGEDHEAVQVLDRPAASDELGGEVVEELGVGRGLAHRAEVVGGADEAFAEVVLPDAVDHDAGEEGVARGVGHAAGEVEAAAACGRCGLVGAADGF